VLAVYGATYVAGATYAPPLGLMEVWPRASVMESTSAGPLAEVFPADLEVLDVPVVRDVPEVLVV
jgi:hypothetical protein